MSSLHEEGNVEHFHLVKSEETLVISLIECNIVQYRWYRTISIYKNSCRTNKFSSFFKKNAKELNDSWNGDWIADEPSTFLDKCFVREKTDLIVELMLRRRMNARESPTASPYGQGYAIYGANKCPLNHTLNEQVISMNWPSIKHVALSQQRKREWQEKPNTYLHYKKIYTCKEGWKLEPLRIWVEPVQIAQIWLENIQCKLIISENSF